MEVGIIERDVGEADQRFVSAPVMPSESVIGKPGPLERFQDALGILVERSAVFGKRNGSVGCCREEVSRRKLFGVSDYNELSTSQYGAH